MTRGVALQQSPADRGAVTGAACIEVSGELLASMACRSASFWSEAADWACLRACRLARSAMGELSAA